jgi:hypothetical protein
MRSPGKGIKVKKMANAGWSDGLWDGECNHEWSDLEVEE